MECRFCGMPLKGSDPKVVWSDGKDREPFCNVECEVAEIVDQSITHAGNRRRDHWLCRVKPCAFCS